MKQGLEQMHEKDANVRRVEMKAIIRLVAKKVVGTWENALAPRCGVAYTEKELKKRRGRQKKNS